MEYSPSPRYEELLVVFQHVYEASHPKGKRLTLQFPSIG